MGKQKAPAPPDYAAAAKEQGAANLEAGQQTAALNRPTQYDSNGSQEWTLKAGADVKNPQAGDWIVTNKLNATQQALKDQQDALSKQYGELASGALGTVGNTMAEKFDTSGLPQASALSNQGLTSFAGPVGPAQHEDVNAAGLRGWGNIGQSNEGTRQSVSDAMYRRQTRDLDPQSEQANSDLRNRLNAQGITAGSEAYNREMDNQSRQQANAYADARDRAIGAGGAEESRINQMNLGNANFQNSTRGQQVGERLGIAGFNNGNRDTEWQQGMAGAQMQNQMRGQQFGESQAMNTQNNILHQNSVQEALMQRQLGMNEANALRTGNQLGQMNFQAYGGGGQINAAPVYQAAGDQFNAGLAATNANNAATASAVKGITGAASTAMMFSDRRLKTDVQRVGTHPSGIGLYTYNYVWGEPGYGVMADEVRSVMPEAVETHSSGYDMVNYEKLDS